MRKIFTLFIATLCCAGLANATEGALPGAFTINANGDKIQFSQGNLQYQASTDTWRFAINQWDTIGADNANISETYSGWIDLFGWGTGGNPTKSTKDDNQYLTFIDWGENAISNGGNTARQWRTLTYDEWEYVFKKRKNASNLRGKARVNYVAGYVFLADNFTIPSGLSFLPDNETENFYTAEAWSMMESAGAVFLPAAGYRSGTRVWYVGEYSYYWSYHSDIEQIESVNGCMEFLSGRVLTGGYGGRAAGRAVRLVTEQTFHTVTFYDWDGTVLKSEEVEPGAAATAPADPTREGYTFVGWDAGFTNVQSDMTITAIYSKPLTGRFSVAADKQIIFAQGNLQYKASDNKWAFSDKQYDMIGSDNAKTSASYSGWIDLFGWGTGNNPVETSKESAPYASFSDWTANPIVNGNNETWYTLSAGEWTYLLSTRPNAANLKGQAVVNDIKGYILLPDNWTLPTSLTFTPTPNNYSTNIYTLDQWTQMEVAGAVFLPAAGDRYGTDINSIKAGNGSYWTPTPSSEYSNMAQAVTFTTYTPARVSDAMVQMGYAVRPARDVKANEGIDQPTSDSSLKGRANKVLRDGVLYIERNGKTYNAMGTEVR